MPSGITIQNLVESLQKAGVPFNAAKPQIESSIMGNGQDPQYQQKIQRLQEMDQKLKGVYADPSSKLFIENPTARERAVSGATNTESRAISGEQKQKERELKNQVSQALNYFKQLDSLAKTEAKKSGKTSKSAKEVDSLKKKTGIQLAEQAGITDPKAQDLFLNLPTAFQEEQLRYILRGEKAPEGGYTKDQIQENYNVWKKERDAALKGGTKKSLVQQVSGSTPTATKQPERRAPEPSILDKIRRSIISLPIPYR